MLLTPLPPTMKKAGEGERKKRRGRKGRSKEKASERQ